MSDFNLGTVTAYGYAKDKGYTGTEAEFAELMASYADVAEQAAESATAAAASATTATTKASEASASASAAASSKTAAQTAQSSAETAATTATTKAGEATTAATTATNKATEATTAATTATTKAGEAATSATNAAASAEAAAESAATLVIDATLTHAGQAADAKATGDAIDTVENDIQSVQTQLEQTTADALSAYATDTATGAIASFPDGADNLPVKDMTVAIEPVQDLHGQSNPYPAGGGKNLCDIPTTTLAADGNTGDVPCVLSPDTYTFSATTNTNVAWVVRLRDANKSNIITGSSSASTAGRQSVTVALTAQSSYINVYFNGATTATDFQIEKGSSASAYMPYSNICPISGWTGANVGKTGANVWDEQWENCSYGSSDGIKTTNASCVGSKNPVPVFPSTTYYFKIANNSADHNVAVYEYDADMNYLGRKISTASSNNPLTTRSDTRYINFYWGTSATTGTYDHTFSINYPSTDTDYHAYNGDTIAIDWTTEAGTVYGGSLGITTGGMTVDRAIVDLGTLTWEYDSASKRFGTQSNAIPIKPISGATVLSNMICSQYKTVKGQDQYDDITLDASISQGGGSSAIVRIRDTAYTDATAFKTAMNGVQLCYELAEPFTVQLTAQEVSTLLGQNNIWSDTGNSTVEYRADTKLYIQKVTNS